MSDNGKSFELELAVSKSGLAIDHSGKLFDVPESVYYRISIVGRPQDTNSKKGSKHSR